MTYDPEAIYQDADIEIAEYAREDRRRAALRAKGVCLHSSSVGIGADGKAHYPEAEGLVRPQRRCTEGCGRVFADDDDWADAMDEAANG